MTSTRAPPRSGHLALDESPLVALVPLFQGSERWMRGMHCVVIRVRVVTLTVVAFLLPLSPLLFLLTFVHLKSAGSICGVKASLSCAGLLGCTMVLSYDTIFLSSVS